MKYQALYRTYRPRTFDDVKGQDVIVRTLKNQVKTGRVAHAYLFCGSRGTGKTTCAKILAQAVNCLHPVDGNPCCECESCRSIQEGSSINVVEMDAASRNGVDDFRRIIEEIAYPPGEGRKKVYIIDEVHMLTPAAFNAFLKTLEEPPDYAVFILATTDPQKLLPTVLSRCQRYDFRRIPVGVIADRLKEVFDAEKVQADEEAVLAIARRAEGGLRDALSIADRCVSFFPGERLTGAHILDVLGSVDKRVFRQMLLVGPLSGGSDETDSLTREDRETLLQDAEKAGEQQIMYYIEVLSELAWSLHNTVNTRVIAEIALINLCRPETMKRIPDSLEARLSRIETQMEQGIVPAQDVPAAGHAASSDQASSAAQEKEADSHPAGEPERVLEKVIVPELFQKIASQWKQTMSSLQNRGRGEVLASCSSITFSKDDPDTLLISLADNWYRSLANDKTLLSQISDAIAAKYGVCPQIRFVNASQLSQGSLTGIGNRIEALQKEGIAFPIQVER